MATNITAAEAFALLEKATVAERTSDFLKDLAKKVSVHAEGKVTVLYGSAVDVGGVEIHTTKIANALAKDPDIRIIDKTDFAEFVSSDAYRSAVASANGTTLTDLNNRASGSESASDFINNSRTGVWAEASDRFVRATIGAVETLTFNADGTRIFRTMELPAALQTEGITTINGEDRIALKNAVDSIAAKPGMDNEKAVDKVFDHVNELSGYRASNLDIVDKGPGGVDAFPREWLSQGGHGEIGAIAPGDVVTKKVTSPAEVFVPNEASPNGNAAKLEKIAHAKEVNDHLAEHAKADVEHYRATGDVHAFEAANASLNKILAVGALISIVQLTAEVKAALDANHPEEIPGIIAHGLADFAKGIVEFQLAEFAIVALLEIAGASVLAPFAVTLMLGYAAYETIKGIPAFIQLVSNIIGDVPDITVTDFIKMIMKDPLILDLDGDGFEISPLSNGALFDADGNGVKTLSAWIDKDDGMLVLDRDGNGTIDSGRELFGDETLLANGDKAANGFKALADLDKGSLIDGVLAGADDGVFDSKDAQFANVRIWKDLNHDGISQSTELFTLADSGVVSINIESSASTVAGKDFLQIQASTFVRADGSVGEAGSFVLAQNFFVQGFPPVTASAEADALPDLHGTGWVRNLRDAATLDPELVELFNSVSNATSRPDYRNAVSELLIEWAKQSDYLSAGKEAAEHGYTLVLTKPQSDKQESWMGMATQATNEEREGFRASLSASDQIEFDQMRTDMIGDLDKLFAYEAFAAHTFVLWSGIWADATSIRIVVEDPRTVHILQDGSFSSVLAHSPLAQVIYAFEDVPPGFLAMNIPSPIGANEKPYVTALWDRLLDDVMGNIMPVTRLSGLLSLITLQEHDGVISYDFSAMNASLAQKISASPRDGTSLFLDLYHYYGKTLDSVGWNGVFQLETLISRAATDNNIHQGFLDISPSTLEGFGTDSDEYYIGSAGADTAVTNAKAGDDVLGGFSGNDSLIGGSGDDLLFGHDGNDTLEGGDGSDWLAGGSGNDELYGGLGTNVYIFGRGDGHDRIYSSADGGKEKANTVLFREGVLPNDLILTQINSTNQAGTDAYSLVINIAGTNDKLTVNGVFYLHDPDQYTNPIQKFIFSDGTVWYLSDILAKTFSGTADNDLLIGTINSEAIYGGLGNDDLSGFLGNDTLVGGVGNDTLWGGLGNNTYLFGRGDGVDHILSYADSAADKLNILQFKNGVLPADVLLNQVNVTDQAGTDAEALVVSIAGTNDKVVVNGFFHLNNPDNAGNPLQQIAFADGTSWNIDQILQKLFAGTTGPDDLKGTITSDAIFGDAGADTINGVEGNDILNGGAGNDILEGRDGSDSIYGGDGNDGLYGGNQDDTLEGGAGNDLLRGDFGNNTYIFGRGDGQDHLLSYADATADKLNTLQFKAGVLPSDLVLKQVADADGYSIEISIAGTTDKVTVNGVFYQRDTANLINPLQQISFADGTSWNSTEIVAKLFAGTIDADATQGTNSGDAISGGAGNDTLEGFDGNDSLNGGDGNDGLYGGNQDDTLEGGAGNDQLRGDFGNNTYVFGRGDGQDHIVSFTDATAGKLNTLQFKAGVLPSDLVLKQVADADGYSMEISIAGTTDKITINGVFYQHNPGNVINPLQQITFADGTSWNLSQIIDKLFANTTGADAIQGTNSGDVVSGDAGNDTLEGFDGNDSLNGGDGNDGLYGGNQDDTLEGGAGNDQLRGDFGNNTYVFGRGDGQDHLLAYTDSTVGKLNTLQFKAGVLPSDLVLKQVADADGYSLEISIAGTTDKVTINGVFYQRDPANVINPLQQISFADGTIWNLAQVVSKVLAGTTGADLIDGTIGNDAIFGDTGNDSLYGETGNDTLDGGTGNDQLRGDAGNNTYLFGRGDGQDHVLAFNDSTAGKLNTLQLKAGVLPADLQLRQVSDTDGYSMEVAIAGTTDKITFNGVFYQNNPANVINPLQQIRFDDGTTWNLSQIMVKLSGGTSGADLLVGTPGADVLFGDAGNDDLEGRGGDDSLSGGDGNDSLYGEGGNDTLDGGAGNDQLRGDTGNDTYVFGRGDGQDRLIAFTDATSGKLSTLQMKAGVLPSDLVLKQVSDTDGYSLEVAIAGTTDKFTINGVFYQHNPANVINPLQQISFADGTNWNLSQIIAKVLAGTTGADVIQATTGDDLIFGDAGGDSLEGWDGNDTINGDGGNDSLYGGNGNDTMDGGAGNDLLRGDTGNNTYLFGRGDGQDRIVSFTDASAGKLNILQMKAGVLPSDLVLSQVSDADGYSLEIAIAGTTDKITVNGVFYQHNPGNVINPLQQISFADGTSWNLAQLTAKALLGTSAADVIQATNGNDVVSGGASGDSLEGLDGNDTISGDAGNDSLYGGNGNDVLDGGAGNDQLRGDAGNNTYLFGRGDGQDRMVAFTDATVGKLNTLQMKAGVLPSDLVLAQVYDTDGYSMEIAITGTTDKITINGFFYQHNPGNVINPLQQISFADGTNWNLAQITAKALLGTPAADIIQATNGNDVVSGGAAGDSLEGLDGNDTISGDAGNDSLYGGNGNDTLDGGAGNDQLRGDTGNNTYLFGRGDGQDRVMSFADATVGKLNTLQLKAGVLPGDLIVRAEDNSNGYSIEVGIAGTSDKIVFENTLYQNDSASQYGSLQQIIFADGTTWNLNQILAKLYTGTSAADLMIGTSGADSIIGGAGNDDLEGRAGNDTLQGGDGNDLLYGESGTDILEGGAGNDRLDGGLGVDSADYSNAPAGVVANILTSTSNDGQGGTDTLVGIENLTGGAFNDVLTGNDSANTLVGNNGDDQLFGNGGDDILEGGAGDDSLYGGTGNDVFIVSGSNQGVDRVQGDAGADELDGGSGDDVITIGTFTGIFTVEKIDGKTGINRIAGTSADNTLDFSATTLVGIASIDGGAGNDIITGSTGADVISGGTGNDAMQGGSGDDEYRYAEGDGDDVIQDSAGTDGIVFGASITPDRVKVTKDLATRNVYIKVLQAGSEVVINTVTVALNANSDDAPIESIKFGDNSVWTIDALINRQVHITGTSSNDVLVGIANENILEGLAGNDSITGGATKDLLIGGVGNDSLAGGAGFDTYRYQSGDGVDFITDTGANRLELTDIAFSQISIEPGSLVLKVDTGGEIHLENFDKNTPSAGAGITEFVFADGLVRSLADVLDLGFKVNGTAGDNNLQGTNSKDVMQGLAGNDVIYGNDGNDVLIGGIGNDLMAGGAGDDIFLVQGADQGADRIQGDAGIDQLQGGSGDDVFTLTTFSGVYTVEIIDGKEGSNKVSGTSGDNTLDFSSTTLTNIVSIDAGAGNDNVVGSAGADLLIGGIGNDLIAGGAGDDVFLVQGSDQGADRIEGDAGSDQLQGGSGDDTFTLTTFSGIYTVEVIDGKEGSNKVVGTSGDNTLDFTNTTLVNIASIDAGAGNDNIVGSAGADLIIGGIGNDLIAGGAGDDVFLVEGSDQGADRIEGDAGTDQLQGGSGDDVFTLTTFSGIYTVETIDGKQGSNRVVGTSGDNTLDFTNTALVNIISIDAGAGNDNVIGSAGADFIIGGTGNDLIAGGAGDDVFLVQGYDQGADRIEGDAGADQLHGGSGDDVFTLTTFSGIYTVEIIDGKEGSNRVVGTSGDNTLDFSGTTLVNIVSIDAGAGNDNIVGSAAADLLIGGLGNDLIAGGAGDDVFLVQGSDQGADRIEGDAGADQLQGGSGDDVFTLTTFSGIYTVEIIDGKEGSNKVVGTSGDNTLDFSGTTLVNIASIDAGAGNDNVIGSAGADLIIGGIGNDLIAGGAGDDVFLVQGSDQGADRIEGDAGADQLQGGSGDDVFTLTTFSGSYTVEVIDGKEGSNKVVGTSGDNTLDFSGTTLVNIAGIDAGAGNDNVTGSAAGDFIIGGVGNDLLTGGAGDDIYVFDAGSGVDTIREVNDATNADAIRFGAAIDHTKLWFTKNNNDLLIAQVGSNDKITVKDWYLDTGHQVEKIETAGFTLPASSVDALVSAMAGYTAPVGLTGVLTPEMQAALTPALNGAWQVA